MITFADACTDPNLFGDWFEGGSWATWRMLDKALFGFPLNKQELAVFHEIAGPREPPTKPVDEAWLCCGRRSAKSLKAAAIVAYMATIGAEQFGFRKRLARGEKGVCQILAVDRAQSRVCLGYLKSFFDQPMLARMVSRETQDGLELSNQLSIEVTTNDRRRVRGRTVVCAIFDEVAHWHSDVTDSPDEEIFRAVAPAMSTMKPGAMIIGISSPHARKGLLWRKFSDHFGRDDASILVIQAPTSKMNPAVDQAIIDDAYRADPVAAAAEFGAQFRSDLEGYTTRERLEALITSGITERAPARQNHYYAFCDPAGGSGTNSMTLAVCHREGDREQSTVILDATREALPPFGPEATVSEFCELLRSYRVSRVVGDRFAGEWPREQFRKHGIHYEPASKPKSEIYGDLLPLINSRAIDLLDDPKLVGQFLGLERQVRSGTRDKIDHGVRGHDDLCNAVAGAVVFAGKSTGQQRHSRKPRVILGYEAGKQDRMRRIEKARRREV